MILNNLSRRSRQINCPTIRGYHLVNQLAKIQICRYIHYPIGSESGVQTPPGVDKQWPFW